MKAQDPAQLDAIITRIESGESQAEIARSLGIPVSTLSWKLSKTPEIVERSARARSMSAEAWLDRGLEALVSANSDNAEISRARYIAQECARRAALRNPAYREKQDHNVSGDMTLKILIDDAQDGSSAT